MKNWKIKYKLFGLSSALMAIILFLGAMSLFLMDDLNSGTTVVSANWLPSVIIAEELNTATSDFRIAEASHVISQDSATMEKHETSLTQVANEISSMFQEYSSTLITNETDRALLERASTLWSQYLVIHNEMISYSRANDTTSAMYCMEHESEDIFNEVSSVFLQLVEFNKSGADEASLYGDVLFQNTTLIISVIMIGGLAFGSICSIFIIKAIVDPVSEIETAAAQILNGELNTEISYTSEDELGNLAGSMRNLCQMFNDIISDISGLLHNMADGDFTAKSQNPKLYVGDFQPLLGMSTEISNKLSQALSHIAIASDQVSTGSHLVADTSQKLAKGATEQTTSIHLLSQQLDDVEERTKTNAENALLAKSESDNTKHEIEDTSRKMKSMVESMDEISENSNSIGAIIKIIEDISFQTNILALNAAVEAARAGTAGKGFAVVAEEVRNLAEKSAESAQNTGKLIEKTLASVQMGTTYVNETQNAILKVVDSVEKVTDLVEGIYIASEKQQASVSEISTEVANISVVIGSNSASTEESAAVSEELSGQSSELKHLVEKFKYAKM